jgi:adenylyl-sulfate kinase
LVLWFTGLSGSGKSAISEEVDKILFQNGYKTFILDGDNVRWGINADLGFKKDEREENIRRIAEVAKLFNDSGIIILTAFISPYESLRQKAKEIIGEDNFIEI